MAIVKQRTDKNVKLIIAWNGAGADNRNNIMDLIDTLNIRSMIDLRGQVDTTRVYAESDVVVIPRVSEERMAFPVRLVEALNMQKPVIVSRICGMEKLVEGWGLSVAPGDTEGLAQAILTLADDFSLRKALQENCASAIQKYDSNVSLDQLHAELIGLVKK
jgi:glycosyltransferase involved in cell wall biosynthesis